MLLLNGTPALIASLMFKDNGLRKINKDLLIKGIGFGILAPSSIWACSMVYAIFTYCLCFSIRETSIIFATLIGLIILKEKDAKSRIIPAIFIVIGIGILYFQI